MLQFFYYSLSLHEYHLFFYFFNIIFFFMRAYSAVSTAPDHTLPYNTICFYTESRSEEFLKTVFAHNPTDHT